ncbi:anoctamin-8-like [Macrobrachium nipponense]|uniref:anoctamin-8-like n=1 Tax=Macrobrachium nipponense TaxID=159736 RepID=UPI0030C89C0A
MDIRRRLNEATKLIQEKIPYGSHVITPKKEWLQTIQEKDCDVVMVMSPTATAQAIGWLQSSMEAFLPELSVSSRYQPSTKSVCLHIKGKFDGLMKGAEQMRLIKKTANVFGGDLQEVTRKKFLRFEGSEDKETFFTTQERQSIVFYFLNSLRTPSDSGFTGVFLRQDQAVVPKLLSRGVIKNVFPLHEYEKLKALKTKWVPGFLKRQPIDDIKDYFGSHIAFYFAWLGHYTTALTIPAILGIMFWSLEQDNKGLVVFAFLNVAWATTWLETWKRRSAEIAYSWGTMDAHLKVFSEPRPQFKGPLKLCPVTGRHDPHYPSWKRNIFRYFVSLPVILVAFYINFRVMLVILQFQDMSKSHLESTAGLSCLTFLPKALMALPIAFFDRWFTKLAIWLNKKENHRSEEDHQNHLIVKLLVFRFINSFLSLFYIAFFLQDLARLREQLAALLVTKQLTGNFKESVLPYLQKRLQLAKLSFKLFGALAPSGAEHAKKTASKKAKDSDIDSDDDSHYPLPEEAATIPPPPPLEGRTLKDTPKPLAPGRNARSLRQLVLCVWGSILSCSQTSSNFMYEGTFKDYLEIFVQFGYVTLFSSAFPLAAACALVANVIEIRSDAFKFCYVFQRPFGQRAQGIGVWQDAMELMGVISIIVNCALIGLSGQIQQIYPDITTNQTILVIVVLEHLLIALKFGISYAIPDVPEWVEVNIAREEFLKRETLKCQ